MQLETQESDSLGKRFELLASSVAEQPQILKDVLDTVYDRVFIKDMQGQVTFANKAFLQAFDLTADQIIGRRLSEFLPTPMIGPCEAADKNVLERGEGTCLETHWVHPTTGVQHWTETHKAPLKDADGTVRGMVGISRDVTARRNIEDELKRQKALLELIVETVPDWIFVKDRQRRIVLANQAFYKDQGLDPAHVHGRESTEFLSSELEKVAYESDTHVLENAEPVRGEVDVNDPDGNVQHLEFRKLPLLEEGEIIGIVSVCRDLTEAKQAEKQLKRNESLLLHAARLSSLGELAVGIAHEVNQPLYSILNYAKAIENKLQEQGNLDIASIRSWVQQIYQEATRGGKITRRLKSFVKPTSPSRKPSEINTLVLESMQFMRIEASDASVIIETELGDDLPKLVLDRIQIQQVLVNLLKNAIEACIEHDVQDPRIVITTRAHADCVEVEVTDNGPGISAKDEQSILDAFETTKHDGVGLGLAISNTIIESHQGQLTYQSNEKGGATFCFKLPKSG